MKNLRLLRNIRLGIKTLMLHKLRSLLTTMGVVFGVASVIAMLAVGEGASAETEAQLRKLGTNNIILTSVKPAQQDMSQQSGAFSIYGLLYEDNTRIAETIPTVVRTAPARQLTKTVRMGDLSMDMRVVGTTPVWFDLVDRRVLAGRVFDARDVQRMAPVCVLTEDGARKLLAKKNTVGQSIRIDGAMFEVIGIVESETGGGGVQTPDQPTDIYMPLTTCRARFGEFIIEFSSGNRVMEKVELHQIIAQVDEVENVEPTADAIQAMLDRFHPDPDTNMSVPLALLRQAEATKRRFNIVLGAIAGISLLVGGIGIMNIMLASVTERTREIGVRRAIGAKRKQIVGQFLVETTVLSTLGGLIGIGLGVLIPYLITHFSGMETVVTAFSLIISVGISLSVGIIFGIYPAIRAANLDPITALRHE